MVAIGTSRAVGDEDDRFRRAEGTPQRANDSACTGHITPGSMPPHPVTFPLIVLTGSAQNGYPESLKTLILSESNG